VALKGPLTTPVGTGFRSINVALRKEFDLYANVRPALTLMTGGRYEDIDLVLIRENTEGLYVGVEHYIGVGDDPKAAAESVMIITRFGAERIVRYAFEYAVSHNRRKVTLRAQGEHPEVHAGPLSSTSPARSRRSTRAASSSRTASSTRQPCCSC
jgi:isocitrate dehydrogenase (NAD+)